MVMIVTVMATVMVGVCGEGVVVYSGVGGGGDYDVKGDGDGNADRYLQWCQQHQWDAIDGSDGLLPARMSWK